jgi:hypothetical protein
LQVIASSPTDVQPIMDVIAENARRLLNGNFSAVYLVDGDMIDEVATSNLTEKGKQVHAIEYPRLMNYESSVSSRAVVDRAVQNIPDILGDMSLPEMTHSYARALNMRGLISVPMMKDKEAIGAINVGKKESGAFTEKEVALLQTFASQAVIAIENVRLFNETQRLFKRGAGSPCCRRSRQRSQELLPRHHEPRDPHTHERCHRHERPAHGHAPQQGTARLRRDHRSSGDACSPSLTTSSTSARSRRARWMWSSSPSTCANASNPHWT